MSPPQMSLERLVAELAGGARLRLLDAGAVLGALRALDAVMDASGSERTQVKEQVANCCN